MPPRKSRAFQCLGRAVLASAPADARRVPNLPRFRPCASVLSMRWNFHFAAPAAGFRIGLFASALAIGLALATPAGQRIHLVPKFTPGETIRYRVETHTTSTGKTDAPIENPEGGSKFAQTVNLLIRLDVLDVQPGLASRPGAVRLRATYEKSASETQTDAFDLAAASLDDRYDRLEGRSIEFSVEPGGQLADFHGLENIFPSRSDSEPALSWANGLSLGAGFPRNGIAIGQHWRSEKSLTGTPLSGLVWRSESTYLRDEPCKPSGTSNASASPAGIHQQMCSVILTRFEIFRRGSPRSDATPEDYRRNGLRTSGTWNGSGQSLDSISLSTGLLVSSTQTSTQKMDYQIRSPSTGSTIHQVGHIETQSVITLVPDHM